MVTSSHRVLTSLVHSRRIAQTSGTKDTFIPHVSGQDLTYFTRSCRRNRGVERLVLHLRESLMTSLELRKRNLSPFIQSRQVAHILFKINLVCDTDPKTGLSLLSRVNFISISIFLYYELVLDAPSLPTPAESSAVKTLGSTLGEMLASVKSALMRAIVFLLVISLPFCSPL